MIKLRRRRPETDERLETAERRVGEVRRRADKVVMQLEARQRRNGFAEQLRIAFGNGERGSHA